MTLKNLRNLLISSKQIENHCKRNVQFDSKMTNVILEKYSTIIEEVGARIKISSQASIWYKDRWKHINTHDESIDSNQQQTLGKKANFLNFFLIFSEIYENENKFPIYINRILIPKNYLKVFLFLNLNN